MSIKLACIQMGATGTWGDNVHRVVTMMRSTDAEFVVLPELFNYCKDFKTGEPIPGRTTEVFTALAREKGVYIVMGSILEVESQPSVTASPLLYNTSILIDPSGSIVAKYPKDPPLCIPFEGEILFKARSRHHRCRHGYRHCRPFNLL